MGGFSGTHTNRVDAKGRVSIPAPFRAILRAPATEGACAAMLRPSHNFPCIEAWPHEAFKAMAATIDQLPTFSLEQEDLAFAVLADAHPVESDKEGRIVIPERLCELGGLPTQMVSADIVFVGVGKIFQIWDPKALELRRAEVRDSLRARRIALPAAAPAAVA